MAASAAATMALSGAVVAPMRNASELGSSMSYSPSLLKVVPLRSVAKRCSVNTRAALTEDRAGRTARREMLAGLMAVSAALVSSSSALASSTTNEKAKDLLKAADDLTNKESPPRFGPGRIGDSEKGTIAQNAGSGAVEGLQGGTTEAVEGAKKTLEQAKQNVDKVFGKKGGIFANLGEQSPDLDAVTGKVKSDISTATEGIKGGKINVAGLGDKVNSSKQQAGSIVADARGKVDELGSKGKEVFDSIQDKSFKLNAQ